MTSTDSGAPIEVLLLAAETAGHRLGDALAASLPAQVQYAVDLRHCQERLQAGGLALLILEESMTWENVPAADALYEAAGSTLILEFNFGTCTAERAVRQARAALQRRNAQEKSIRMSVMLSLQNQLNASVTGLLLESQMALRSAGPKGTPAMQQLVGLAEALCAQLRV